MVMRKRQDRRRTYSDTRLIEHLASRFGGAESLLFLDARYGRNLDINHEKMGFARRMSYLARSVVVAGGILLPAAATAQSRAGGDWRIALSVATILLSLLVALATGLTTITRIDERWRIFFGSRDALRGEGWMLAESVGPYADGSERERFQTFVLRVEALLSSQSVEYLRRVTVTNAAPPDKAPDDAAAKFS